MRGLEREYSDRLGVVWLNVGDQAGEQARESYGLEKLPAVILLDANGSEVYRTEGKLPRTVQVREKMAQLQQSR